DRDHHSADDRDRLPSHPISLPTVSIRNERPPGRTAVTVDHCNGTPLKIRIRGTASGRPGGRITTPSWAVASVSASLAGMSATCASASPFGTKPTAIRASSSCQSAQRLRHGGRAEPATASKGRSTETKTVLLPVTEKYPSPPARKPPRASRPLGVRLGTFDTERAGWPGVGSGQRTVLVASPGWPRR